MKMKKNEYVTAMVCRRTTKSSTPKMTMEALRQKAVSLGVSPGKFTKTDLIHAIQIAEGNTPCFGFSIEACPYTDCCFRADCLKC